MISTKKLLYKIIEKMETKSATLTRTNNNYVDATAFARMSAESNGRYGLFHCNLQTTSTLASGSGFQQIGTMSPAPSREILACIPCQNNASTIMINVTSAGVIQIINTSGTATGANSFFRAEIPYIA